MSHHYRVLAAAAAIAFAATAAVQVRAAGADRRAGHPGQVEARLQSSGSVQTTPSAAYGETIKPVIDKYCVGCHNTRVKTAGLVLDSAELASFPASAPVWEKVIKKLRTEAMPPAGLPRPDRATYDRVASALEDIFDRAATAHPNPGRAAVHRLNRFEYGNAVRDLLGLEVDVRSLLPPDDLSYGFDNIADVLSLSPALMDRYLSAGRFVSRLAVGDPASRPSTQVYSLLEEPVLMQDERMGDDLPFGSRGGLAVRHHFPLDGEYEVTIRLQRTRDNNGEIRGLEDEHEIDVRLDRARVQLLTVGRRLGELPPRDNLPVRQAPGARRDEQRLQYEIHADDDLKVRFSAKAGTHLLQVAFVDRVFKYETAREFRLPNWGFAVNKAGEPAIERVSVTGPFGSTGRGDTASRRKLFTCRPRAASEEEACASKILESVARRAYRRPVSREDVAVLLGFYRAERAASRDFDAGIEAALRRVLVDPEFLFRVERPPTGTAASSVYTLSDLELASRLSFFLWSSIPDERLLDLSARGELGKPQTLTAEVRRMLAGNGAETLATNFASQWLHLRNMRTVTPDPAVFPEFTENLRDDFQRETELFVASTIRDDRSVVELLSADYTYLNERLAKHYGISGVSGSHFRRVQLPSGPRGGLLGQGSILTATSYSTRTAPTIRGKWVLDNLLGAPPPPPPPNVPALAEEGPDGRQRSMREAMEAHRRNPACSSCHARMDPLGFALENFDGIGQWRETESGAAINAEGVLPDGTRFDGPSELRKLLLSRQREFATAVVEKLMTYALGRGVDYFDAPAIRKIVRAAEAQNFRWSALILGVVQSDQFRLGQSAAKESSS